MIDTRLFARRRGAAAQVSGFASAARNIYIEELVDEYGRLMQTAPQRHERSLKYLVDHSSSVAGLSGTNQAEQHLAANLIRSGTAVFLPDGRQVKMVGFQIPLTATQEADGLGCVDLLGLTDRVVVIELKVVRPGGAADTPLTALIEGLAYTAVVEANLDDIRLELTAEGFSLGTEKPQVAVLGPESYWAYWRTKEAAGNWRKPLDALATAIDDRLGLTPVFLALPDRWQSAPVSKIILGSAF